jgi:hypothetical protein
MNPEVKAIELVNEFIDYVNCWDDDGNCNYRMAKEYAKECSLIAVNGILKVANNVATKDCINYWQEVKREIEKL